MTGMTVRTNVNSLNAHRNLKNVGSQQSRAAARLSSGFRINSAADDAAGLAISETMRAQIRGLDRAAMNSQDGISLLQTADGAMQEITNMIQRMREIAVQAANDTNTETNRMQLNLEFQQLKEEIDRIVRHTEIFGVFPLRGHELKDVVPVVIKTTELMPPLPHVPTYPGPNPPAPNTPEVLPCAPLPTMPSADVPDTGGTLLTVTGPIIDISSGGTYRVNAADLVAHSPIYVTGTGGTLIIVGDLIDTVVNTEAGQSIRLNGGVLQNSRLHIESGSTAQIAGNVAGTVVNNGDARIDGNVTASGIVQNNGNAKHEHIINNDGRNRFQQRQPPDSRRHRADHFQHILRNNGSEVGRRDGYVQHGPHTAYGRRRTGRECEQ